ncbi:MAG: methylmalonyl-CoA mutase family protein, partial [Pseudomonadota bacterium]
GQDTILGVNKHQLEDEDDLQILEVDNAKVRKQQVERLENLKSKREDMRPAFRLGATLIAPPYSARATEARSAHGPA